MAAHRQADPHRLSQLVRGDLDWIVMKALEKDRTRRYDTASNFAADVLRYLSDQPVEARPPRRCTASGSSPAATAWRSRPAMVVLAAILLGTVVSVTQAIRATRAERLAQTRLQTETEARNEAESRVRLPNCASGRSRPAANRRKRSESRRRRAQLYMSQMNLAENHWNDNNADRARELLESQMPEHTGGVDLRGWEWHYLWRLSHSELRRLKFPNDDWVLCVAFSPDGQLLVSGDADGTLKMWDAGGTREVRTIKAHDRQIHRTIGIQPRWKTVCDGIARMALSSSGKQRPGVKSRTFPGLRQGLSVDGAQSRRSSTRDRVASDHDLGYVQRQGAPDSQGTRRWHSGVGIQSRRTAIGLRWPRWHGQTVGRDDRPGILDLFWTQRTAVHHRLQSRRKNVGFRR